MAKRALINREHQIYRMANGRWYARPTIPGIGRREYALGDVSTLPAAIRKKNQIVARVIEEAAAQRAKKERDRYSSLVLCDELVDLRASKADATYEQTEIFFRKHIKPFLEAHCPDARELRPVLWERYKNAFRLKRPTGRLFNHWKFWTMLFKYAHEKGILDTRFKLPFDEGKEDSRARGQKIPDDDFRRLYLAANQTWKDRMVLGRLTGQRPGLIRKLRKDQVDLMTGIVNVQKKDSKNRRGYAFRLPDQALEILRRRSKGESPYFFPSEANLERPMGNGLKGWKAACLRAGVNETYTPHDLRHTYLTEKVLTDNNHAALCYQADITLDELRRTYLHPGVEDTLGVARHSTEVGKRLLGSGGNMGKGQRRGVFRGESN